MPPRKSSPKAALAVKPLGAGPFLVAGQTMYLDLPERPHHRAAIVTTFRASQHDPASVQLVLAAALGLCWGAGSLKDGAPAYRHRLLDYGAEMLDWLFAAGVEKGDEYLTTEAQITSAGNAAINLIVASVLTVEDLEEARGNSPAPEGSGSASSSA